MNEEIDLYKDVDKIHSHEYYEPKAAVNDTSKVWKIWFWSIFLNLIIRFLFLSEILHGGPVIMN